MAKEGGSPWVRIVNDDGMGHHTRILTPGGEEIKGVHHVDISIPVDGLVEATLGIYTGGIEVDAYVKEIKETILPPPLPKTQYRLTVDAPQPDGLNLSSSKYRLEKLTPLPTYGVKEELLADGFMLPIGPLELVCDAPE